MRTRMLRSLASREVMPRLAFLGLSLWLGGCGSGSSYVRSDTTLGRVVVYRNGVAYFERRAEVKGDTLRLTVPGDKVDDFLKSLTVTDAKTGQPAPVSYPSGTGGQGTIDMKIALPGSGPHEVKLSYVTDAPSWKPSYRVTLGDRGKVNVQAWAIVDNTSGEDWDDVKLGVGSSSAMSFRFDLRSLRVVERQSLRSDDLFALAPPNGGATFGGPGTERRVLRDFSDEAIALQDAEPATPPPAPVANAPKVSLAESKGRGRATAREAPAANRRAHDFAADSLSGGNMTPNGAGASLQQAQADQRAFRDTAESLKRSQGLVMVEGYATQDDKDKQAASLDRANRLREQLVRNGLDPNRVVAVGKGEQAGRNGGARILEVPQDKSKQESRTEGDAAASVPAEPIGTSHFESGVAMSVPKGTSAMVSILKSEAEGEVVYLYDAESPRGNAAFPFKAVRFKNPAESQLEQGPVTVFGDGRFIGEGMTDPIPSRSTAFVPYALDRQIVVDRKDAVRDEIARILSVQRGVFSTEVKHTKKRAFTLQNRLSEKAVVYVRHTVAPGFKLTHAPPNAERLGNAQLFRVEVLPQSKTEVVIEESTPVFRSTDIRSADGFEMVKVYLSSATLDPSLKAKVSELVKLHQDMAKVEQQIATAREQMKEYRTRMDELHAQLVTLKAVKTAGSIMGHLERKLQEISERVSKATVDLVSLEEKLMVSRVRFQDGVAELSLEPTNLEKMAGKS